MDRIISKDRQIDLVAAFHAQMEAYIAESNKAMAEARKIADDAAKIELRRLALAAVTKKDPAGFRYKGGNLGCFAFSPPGRSGFFAMPIYFVFTPAEASAAVKAGQLHRAPLGETKLAGQVYQVFSNETPANLNG